jgi:endonuclease/exonuclease/phosphatase family metal-dependent hydrolase
VNLQDATRTAMWLQEEAPMDRSGVVNIHLEARIAERFAIQLALLKGRTPEDIAREACDMAAALVAEQTRRGWLVWLTESGDGRPDPTI